MCLGYVGWVAAQSLGTPTAEAWIGRPLEMSVPARFAPDSECVHADVFFGENRVRSDQVRALVVGPDGQKRVRVQTDTLINEPIVTVSVRAGCTSTITRNYTLLPELPSDAVIAGWNRAAQANFAAATAPSALRMATATAPVPVPRLGAPRPVAAQRVAPAPAPEAAKPAAQPARAFRKDAPPRGPRLRLEPLEFEQQTVLRVSPSLAQPAGDPSQRATAALLWQAINADPQELLRTSAMLQKLESDLLQLRQSSNQTRAEMAALRRRLDQAQPWYASPVLAQVLLLLVLVAATTATLMWWRSRRALGAAAAWYAPVDPQEPQGPREEALPVADDTRTAPPAAPAVAQPMPGIAGVPGTTAAAQRSSGAGPIDLELPPKAAAAAPRSPTGVLRVETLAATLDEVEFLASLGLTGDAIDVLKTYLQDSTSPAPVAYLELLRMCEQAEDPAAVGMVRRRYRKAFGIAPPALPKGADAGLEGVPHLSARISAAWGRPEAMDLIEQVLFDPPTAGVVLTPQAGRDLVALHALAVRVAAEAGGTAPHPADPVEQALAPWAHADDPAAAVAAAQASAEAEGGHHFALDVDLAAAPEPLPEPADPAEDLKLAPLLEEMKAAAAREAERRARQQEEDAFSAAVSSERVPVSRY